ncbi:MAG: hypothetical protein F6K39_32240 [Okeania sp. SIO3B3]|nr:hypothetical protein [Okeania sp. SIO3B3]
MVAKINTFINNSTESSLLIQYDLRWKWKNLLPLAISIIFLGIGILILYAVFYLETLTLNKSKRQLTYKVFYLFGTETKHYSFDQIQELILYSYIDSDGDKSYSLKVALPAENQNDRRKIPLMFAILPTENQNDRWKIPLILNDSDIEKVKKLANVVSDFIEKPYQELSNK